MTHAPRIHPPRAARPPRVRILETPPRDYMAYLQSNPWQTKRKAALKRAGHACQVCNGGGPLHVHHRTYARLGRELARDLTVLCDECHTLFHDHGRLH